MSDPMHQMDYQPNDLRRMIARRKMLDFVFAGLGMLLVIASLSVLVALFGTLTRDGGKRLVQTHDVKKDVGSSRVDLQACKLEYSIVSPK